VGDTGASADKDGAGWRFDFLDASALCNLEPPSSSSFIAAKDLILTDINQSASGDRPKMPPEPGRLLEDWQKTTLERFVASVNALPAGPERAAMIRGPMPADARAPKIAVQYSRLNDVLLIDYSVTDENADPVIGELWVGDKLSASIAASGRGQAAFNLSGQPRGSSLQVTARLCDGWGLKTRGAADGLPSISN